MYIPGWGIILILNAVFFIAADIRSSNYSGDYNFGIVMDIGLAVIASLITWVIYLAI